MSDNRLSNLAVQEFIAMASPHDHQPGHRHGIVEMMTTLEGWSHPVVLVDSTGSGVYLNGSARSALESDGTLVPGEGDSARAETLTKKLRERFAKLSETPSEVDLGIGGVRRWLASVIRGGDGQRLGTMLSAL